MRLFADDTIVYMTVTNESDAATLQKDLELLEEWETKSQMSFHPDKCNVLRVTRSRKPLNFNYVLHNQTLEEKDTAKYLGVTVNHKLSWNEHICNIYIIMFLNHIKGSLEKGQSNQITPPINHITPIVVR